VTAATPNKQLGAFDRALEQRAVSRYPETARLHQVTGVGLLTALSFVLTVEDPARCARSRSVGAYFGLVPRRHQSGARVPQLRIAKTGRPTISSASLVLDRRLAGIITKQRPGRAQGSGPPTSRGESLIRCEGQFLWPPRRHVLQ
jgi:hypothetical protein